MARGAFIMVRVAAQRLSGDEQAKPNENSGAELVRLAKGNSREAWETIYRANYPALYRYVRARVGDQGAAEDLTAEVFLEAVKGISSYEYRDRPLLAWLFAIARNLVNYHYRASARRPRVAFLRRHPADTGAGRVLEVAGAASASPGVETLDLARSLALLPEGQREVIILRHYVGLTTPEIARLLRKHERAVYSLQARAIKALRRMLS